MAIIEDILRKKGVSPKKIRIVSYVSDSIYWIVLMFFVLRAVNISNELCLQAIYEANTKCFIVCSANDSFKYLNYSDINVIWTNEIIEGGELWQLNQ